MTRQKVDSSMLRSVGHAGDTLEAEFGNGAIYRFEGISAQQFTELLAAESVGGYFNKHIRPGCTSCVKVVFDRRNQVEAESVAGR